MRTRENKMNKFPLTLPQKDILNEQLLFKGSSIYNIGAVIEIMGPLDYQSLNKAYRYLIHSNDSYQIALNDDLQTFRFQSSECEELGYKDFSTSDNPIQRASNFIRKEFLKPFNLKGDSALYRFCLIKISRERWFLFSVYHHIIVDGWGTSLMFQRLVETYNSLIQNEQLPQFRYSYKAFVEDDLIYSKSENMIADRTFWMERFAELPESFIPLLESKQARSSRYQFEISRTTFNIILDQSKRFGITQFHYILGLLFVLLNRYFQQGDLTLGLPILNRANANFKKTVGLFMGVNLLRIQVNNDSTFTELLNEIRKELRAIYKHQRYPVGRLIQELRCSREPERLLNVTVSYEKQSYSDNFINTETIVRPLSHEQERVALALYIREFDEQRDVVIDFDYNKSYFSKSMIENFVKSFQFILSQTISNPNVRISDIEILTGQSKREIVLKGVRERTELKDNDTVIHLFKKIAHRHPTKIAVQHGLEALTYSELDRKSDIIAARIVSSRDTGRDSLPTAILMNRSCYLVIAILGALKSGRPFVPIDPSLPNERINYILSNSRSKIVILDDDYLDHDIATQYKPIVVNKNHSDDLYGRIPFFAEQSDSAYIIYTSGTTGNPKGVEVGHRSLLNFVNSMRVEPGMRPDDLIYSVTTHSFDIFYLEMLLPLVTGAELYIASQEILSNPELTIKDLHRVRPTFIQSTPSFFQRLIDLGWQGLSSNLTILSGGDTLCEKLAEKLLKRCQSLWNMYGPTETTIWSTVKQIKIPKDVRTLGTPIYNTNLYILGKANEILPVGIVGHIFIGGEGLAKGYYNNEDLTASKFIYHQELEEHVYDTGDLGRWNDLSEIELLGRDDYQVKIRGFRVEITEIENVLSQINGIDQGIVIAKELNGFKRLIAYVISSILDEQYIKNEIKRRLPSYMIPDRIIFLQSFPKTANGKLDRKVLLGMHMNSDVPPIIEMTTVEKKLKTIYEKVLDVSGLNIQDDFFDIGGHSMSLTALISQIKSEFEVDLFIKDIYENPSIRDLGMVIESFKTYYTTDKENDFVEDKPFVLTDSQANIWYECQKLGKESLYNMGVTFSVEGHFDVDEMERYIQEIVDHNDALNLNFRLIDDIPMQVFQKKERFKFNSLSGEQFRQVAFSFYNQEFDLESDLLIRGGIYKEGQSVFLMFCTHHLIMDGYSVDLLIEQLTKKYQGFSQTCFDQNKGARFGKYIRELPSSYGKQKGYEYWKEVFLDFDFKKFLLPLADKGESSIEYKVEIRKKICEREFLFLKDLALEKNVTLNTLMTLLVAIFLNRLTSASEFMIGITYHGREQPCYSKTLGMFVHTIPIKVKIDVESNVLDRINIFKEVIIGGYKYCSFPFSEFYKQGLPFEVLVANQKIESLFSDELHLKNFKLLAKKDVPYTENRIPLIFTIHEYNDKLIISLTSASIYSQRFTDFILTSFSKLILDFIQNPKMSIKEFDVFFSNKLNDDEDFDFIF